MIETLSIKVSKSTKTRLKALARARKTSPSALLREAIEHVLSGSRDRSARPSLHELSRDLFEDLGPGGPSDLSSDPRHMEGFGQ
jgi:predicted DNA-binding protein